MALSAKRQLQSKGRTDFIEGKLKESDTYYKGAILCYDVNGLLAVGAGAATDIPAGIYQGFGCDPGDDGLTVGAGVNPDANVEEGMFWIPFATAAQADVGELFYVADDETVTQTAGTNAYGLMCKAFKTGYVLLDFKSLVKV